MWLSGSVQPENDKTASREAVSVSNVSPYSHWKLCAFTGLKGKRLAFPFFKMEIKLIGPSSHNLPWFPRCKKYVTFAQIYCWMRETNIHFLSDLLSFPELQQWWWKRWLWFIIRSFSGVMECLQSTIKHWSVSQAWRDISFQQTSQQAWQPAYQWPSHICM